MAGNNNLREVGIRVTARTDPALSRTLRRAGQETRSYRERMTSGLDRDARAVDQVSKKQRQLGRTVGGTVPVIGRQVQRLREGAAGAQRYARDLGKAAQQNKLLQKSTAVIGKGLDAASSQWAAVGGALGGGATALVVVGLTERYERLGIQANKSREDMVALREEVFAISQAPDMRVDNGEVLSAIEQIVEKTGDLQLARENMKNIAWTLSATGAAGSDVGAMIADMSDKFQIRNSADMLKQLDTLVVQGKAGAFTLQSLASKGARVSAAYSAMGRTGPQAVREMGALLQVAMMGTGEADVAATAFEATLQDLVANADRLEDLDVDLFDPQKLAAGVEEARSIPEVLKDIVKATDGNVSEFSELFGAESARLVNVLAAEYKKTGQFGSLDKFMSMRGDGSQVMQDSARAADNAAAAWRSLSNAWTRMADGALAGPIQALADAMNSLDPDTVQAILKALAGGAALIGGLAIGRKAIGVGQSVRGLLGRDRSRPAGSAKNRASAGLAGVDGPTPVIVTNMPSGFGSKETVRTSVSSKGRQPAPRKSTGSFIARHGGKALGLAGKAVAPLAWLNGALSIGSTLLDDQMNGEQKTQALSADAGGLGGTLAGAAAGAAIGSVVPVIGTAIGGLIGSLLGGVGGSWLGGQVGSGLNRLTQEQAPPSAAPMAELVAKMGQRESRLQQAAAASAAPVSVHMGDLNFVQQPGERDKDFLERARSMMREELERAAELLRRQQSLGLTDSGGHL